MNGSLFTADKSTMEKDDSEKKKREKDETGKMGEEKRDRVGWGGVGNRIY